MSDWAKFNEIITFFSALAIVVGSLANMVAIIAMCNRWSSLKSTEVFIFVLMIIDLCLSSALPVAILNQLGTITFPSQNYSVCQFLAWFAVTLNTQSAWVLVAIAVDRFIMIVAKPYSFRTSTNKWKILMINFTIFLLASMMGVPYLYRMKYINRGICSIRYISAEQRLIHAVCIFVIQMVIPAFILTILYAFMIMKLRKPTNFQENNRAVQRRKQRNWKVIKLFLSIIFIFYVTALPYQICYMIYTIYYNKREAFDYVFLKYVLFSSWTITSLNYCIDPFIYASFYMTDIKRKIRSTLLRHRSLTNDLLVRETIPMQAR